MCKEAGGSIGVINDAEEQKMVDAMMIETERKKLRIFEKLAVYTGMKKNERLSMGILNRTGNHVSFS